MNVFPYQNVEQNSNTQEHFKVGFHLYKLKNQWK